MIYIIRNADRTIKTFLEKGADCVLQPGETLEIRPESFTEYAGRLRLSVDGRSGELIRVEKGSGMVEVLVEAAGAPEMALQVNNLVETVPLEGGRGRLLLGTEESGRFEISPADRTQYCAAGEAMLAVEVVE